MVGTIQRKQKYLPKYEDKDDILFFQKKHRRQRGHYEMSVSGDGELAVAVWQDTAPVTVIASHGSIHRGDNCNVNDSWQVFRGCMPSFNCSVQHVHRRCGSGRPAAVGAVVIRDGIRVRSFVLFVFFSTPFFFVCAPLGWLAGWLD